MKIVSKFKIVASILVVGIIVVSTILSCDIKEDLDDKSVVKVKTEDMSKFDKFLKREFMDPYNIEVVYRLNDVETDINFNVSPVKEEKAIQIANLIKYLCLDAYKKHSDKGFLKKTFPKKIILIGSAGYKDENGTQVLGTAAGGVQIVLYALNNLDPTNADALVEMYFNTIFHEFSHILHQNKNYSKDFQKISPNYIGSEWKNYWGDADAGTEPSYTEGFISDYSTKEKNEDFVEIISHQITLSDGQWDARIDPNGDNAEGVEIMDKKLSIVKSYLKNSWNISLDDMKTEVQERLGNLSNIDIDNVD